MFNHSNQAIVSKENLQSKAKQPSQTINNNSKQVKSNSITNKNKGLLIGGTLGVSALGATATAGIIGIIKHIKNGIVKSKMSETLKVSPETILKVSSAS